MKISIDFNHRNNRAIISLLPLPFEQLCMFFGDRKIAKVSNIHICCWDEKDNDILINNDNYLTILGSLNNINELDIFLKHYDDYTINKLELSVTNIIIKYDDDSYLVIDIQSNSLNEMIEDVKSICFRYLNDILKIENLGSLLDDGRYKPDGPGPNLEKFGGTPYHYKTREYTIFFKPVEEK